MIWWEACGGKVLREGAEGRGSGLGSRRGLNEPLCGQLV